MKILLGILAVIILLALVLGGMSCSAYNGLVSSSQGVDSSWAQVQTAYQRRADLIPNIVNTVKGSANFEQSTLLAVTEARNNATKVTVNPSAAPSDPAQLKQFEQSQAALSQSLSRLLVTVERYPDLKSSQNFLALQAQLEGTENRISTERGNFNTAVQTYNTKVKSFPSNLFAGAFNFPPKPYFAADAGAQAAPTVNFDFGKPAPTTR